MSSWPDAAWWALGLLAALALLVALLPWLIQPLLRLVLGVRYGFRVVGAEHLPERGAGLLASNHVTWIDGFLVAGWSPRRGKALVNAGIVDRPFFGWLARRCGIIPVPFQGPKAQRSAIEAARAALARGDLLLIFPEAQLTRTGFLGPFYRGLELMVKGRDGVPIIPVYLANLWGSVFSSAGGRFFAFRPRGLRRVVVIAFGPPLRAPVPVFAVRQAVQEASVRAFEFATSAGLPLDPARLVDPDLPHWRHPVHGVIAGSAPDFDRDGIHQTGHKPGTVGQAPPGVALRVVAPDGTAQAPDTSGAIQALLPGASGWRDTGRQGRLDPDGFLTLEPAAESPKPAPSS
jgi:1-acyl-sn-glycerol-3-phosphate acyltransferase